jgi:hypothetical protein
MNIQKVFRQLVGVGDPELIFLAPLLPKESVGIEDVDALRRWCLIGLVDRPVSALATAKMVSLGLLDASDVGDPIEILSSADVEKFPPVSFLRWKMLENNVKAGTIADPGRLLDLAINERYPPALTTLAFEKMASGMHDEYMRLIEEAAVLGDPVAMNIVGDRLLSSDEPSACVRGIELIRAAADGGYFWACDKMEMIYRFGRYGVPIDLNKADHYAAAVDLEL